MTRCTTLFRYSAIETYNLMSLKWFTHPSPTLFNGPNEAKCLFEIYGKQIEEEYLRYGLEKKI